MMRESRRRVHACTALAVVVFAGACSSSAESPTASGPATVDTAADTSLAEAAPAPAPVTETADTSSATDGSTPSADAATETEADAETFAPLNVTVGYGLLRVMTLEERPSPRDVVIYEVLPNEMSRVAGVITTVPQTPLSHVNLRAVQDGIPNSYVPDALDDPALSELIGRYVRYEVTADGFTVEPATQEQVEAHHAAARPSEPQTPQRDLTVREITPLSEIGFEDWTTFGVKAANLATLASFELADVDVPDGHAVPFSFYDEFMTSNGFYERVTEMLADPEFRSDPDEQDRQLAALREAIEDAAVPDWMVTELTRIQQSFPSSTSIRCRSSTNNEDLPGFSGAGLYDSKTQHPEEGHLSKCLKQVYASVWNLRAFLERDFYRVDHLTTAMGVLLHPNASDEQANGVAVSIDPVYDTPGAQYVNTQLGEDLVTNPDMSSIPEALLIYDDGEVGVVSRSNLVEPGTMLLTDAQIAVLSASLETIHQRFADLYDVEAGEEFAMEIEFKVTSAGSLSIKQARTWVFN